MTKRAEDQGLVIQQFRLIQYYLDEGRDLGIIGVKTPRQLEQSFDLRTNLVNKAQVDFGIVIVGLHDLETEHLPGKNVLQQRCQAIEAACRLTADGRHQELHVLLPMAECQNARDDIEQAIV